MYNEKKFIDKLKVFMLFGFVPVLAFLMVVIIPFIIGIFVTLTDWTGIGGEFNFLGFENFQKALSDPSFWYSFKITLKYVVVVVIATNILAISLALLVTNGFKGQNLFRTAFFTPNIIGGVILGFIWVFIFSRVFVFFGKTFGIEFLASSWLGNSNMALWALIIVAVWQFSGYMMLIYIAGLAGVPSSIIEASTIDGASKFQTLLYVKIPMMVPAFTISLFLTLQKAFMTFDTNLTLTGGGPYNSTELITMNIYNEAFLKRNYGVGQAKAIIFFIIVATIALLQVVALKRKEVDAL